MRVHNSKQISVTHSCHSSFLKGLTSIMQQCFRAASHKSVTQRVNTRFYNNTKIIERNIIVDTGFLSLYHLSCKFWFYLPQSFYCVHNNNKSPVSESESSMSASDDDEVSEKEATSIV